MKSTGEPLRKRPKLPSVPMDQLKALGSRIRAARREFGISISDLAEDVDLLPMDISDIEQGKNTDTRQIVDVCSWLGAELDSEPLDFIKRKRRNAKKAKGSTNLGEP